MLFIDPVSITTVTIAALAAANVSKIVKALWEDVLLPRMKQRNKLTMTSQSGEKITVDASEHLTKERIEEIVAKLAKHD